MTILLYKDDNWSGSAVVLKDDVDDFAKNLDMTQPVDVPVPGTPFSLPVPVKKFWGRVDNEVSRISVTKGESWQVYEGPNFSGDSATLKPGDYTRIDLETLGISDNSISSVRIVTGTKVELYENDNFKGKKLTQVGDENDLRNEWLRFSRPGFPFEAATWNDQVSSLKIIGNDKVTFYEHENEGGVGVSLAPGNYTLTDLRKAGIPNDWISSFDIG